jgi:hypothetical protein
VEAHLTFSGMFLYARLLLDYLSNNIFLSGGELKESIEKLPATVAELYVYLVMI